MCVSVRACVCVCAHTALSLCKGTSMHLPDCDSGQLRDVSSSCMRTTHTCACVCTGVQEHSLSPNSLLTYCTKKPVTQEPSWGSSNGLHPPHDICAYNLTQAERKLPSAKTHSHSSKHTKVDVILSLKL